MVSTYFKTRLRYLRDRMEELDLVNLMYYQGGWDSTPFPIVGQVGKTVDDLLLESGSAHQGEYRDYFIRPELLPSNPREGDIILDSQWETIYARVSTLGSTRTTYRYTTERRDRYRIHTSVQNGPVSAPIPTYAATWLRSDAIPVSLKVMEGLYQQAQNPQSQLNQGTNIYTVMEQLRREGKR